MKAILQRVKSASVSVDNQLVSSIGRGILVFAAVGKEDTEADADRLASHVVKAKLWHDENDKAWKKSVQDIDGEILCVSQFTLYAYLKRNHQPDFHRAADVETARRVYDYFYQRVGACYKPEKVKNGVFQAMMEIELKNDGPVGVDYRSADAAVTIEINTQLPKTEKKASDKKTNSESESSGQSEDRKVYEFKLPPELLE